jgi:hypothetical protein
VNSPGEQRLWRIVDGPFEVEVAWSAVCWRWTVQSATGRRELTLWVYVADTALGVHDLPGVTRAAIDTEGRSEVERPLWRAEPERRIVLDTRGRSPYHTG